MAQCKWPGPDSKVPEDERERLRCPRETYPGHDFCLFHIPLQEKNQDPGLRDEFEEEFRGLYEQGEWDFAGFEFPDNMQIVDWDSRMEMVGCDFRRLHEKEGREAQEGENTRPVNFSYARFGNEAIFYRAHFGDEAIFRGAHFGDEARFWHTRFGDKASFISARFGNKASFFLARFGDKASFSETRFGDEASFDYARFGDKASFSEARFGDEARFWEAHFGDGAEFVQTIFAGKVDWRGVQGRERAYMAQGGPQGEEQSFRGEPGRSAAPGLIFDGTTFGGSALFREADLSRTRFQYVDLGKVSFLHSQISRTKFISCTWATGLENRRFLRHLENHKTGEQEEEKNQRPWLERRAPLLRLRRPRLLFDELLWRRQRVKEKPINDALDPFGWLWQALWRGLPEQQTEFPKSPYGYKNIQPGDIEVLALQLKRSLEDTKDPITAGDFHFAAMEMKREKARDQGRRGRAGVLWFHKMLSGYGERYGRTMVWIALLVALSAVAYWWIGEDGLKCAPEAAPQGGSAGHIAWLDYLSFAMQNVLPFKFSHPILLAAKPWVRLLCFGETFIGTTLFTFFVLALRRRFRR